MTTLTNNNDFYLGNSSDEIVWGLNGHDLLNGAAGNDTLFGGAGDDLLIGGLGNDKLFGGAGTDTASYLTSAHGITVRLDLGTASNAFETDELFSIENAIGSNHSDDLVGNALANVLSGQGGNDRLVGSAGGDTLHGGAGIDTVDYSASAKAVSASLLLGMGQGGDAQGDTFFEVENLIGSIKNDYLQGNAGMNVLSGGEGADVLMGLNGKDTLIGGDGNDSLFGGNAADTLAGGEGDDLIVGGEGRDEMSGNAGIDTFDFNSIADSGATFATRDVILDYEHGVDIIDLVGIDADFVTMGNQAFTFIGTSAFSGALGELRVRYVNGDTYVDGNVSGNASADFSIRIGGIHALTAADFIL